MAQKILVPLDGSEAGEAVLPKLETLILRNVPGADVEITLLRVIPVVNFNVLTTDERAQLPYTESDRAELTKTASDYLEAVAGRLSAKGFKTATLVRTGPAAEEIVEAARDIGVNLIAMSTHGRNGIIRWAIGSVSDRVIRLEGKIPVLAVHATDKDGSPRLPLNSLQSLMKHG